MSINDRDKAACPMKPRKQLSVKPIAALLAGLGAWAVWSGPARAEPNWVGMSSINFPAHVKNFVFPSGREINQSHSLCWGKWCVSFGTEAPVANYLPGDSELRVMTIAKLKCKNPVVGTKQCRFTFVNDLAQGRLKCWLQIPDMSNLSTRIDCPDVHLQ